MLDWYLILMMLAWPLAPVAMAYWIGPPPIQAIIRRMGYTLIVLVLLALVVTVLTATIAFAFPENVRHGYPSCAACHVSGAAGGGAVNAYGRSAAAEFMSTWATRGEENVMPGVEAPDWLHVGGDQRYIGVRVTSPQFETFKHFPMQRDFELALQPIKPVTIGGSFGYYGPDKLQEVRRSYLKLQFGDHLSVRAGRFMPAYGIMFPDHRLPTRSGLGFGEGQETHNLEVSLTSGFGEITATGVYGTETSLLGRSDHGYTVDSSYDSGLVVRSALFVGDSTQLGASCLALSSYDSARTAHGVFALVGFTKHLYLLAEYDRQFKDGTATDLATAKLGFEPIKGVHVAALGDMLSTQRAAGASLQWFPRPHWELLGEFKRSFAVATEDFVDSGVLMVHYYL